ncbi:MAG: hypothetical protein LCH81_03660 [Bacteroidetes bacterium]|nr:hypothetical protein [Bacteroidota bacterium]
MRTFIFVILASGALNLAGQTADTTVHRRCWGIKEKAALRLYPSEPVKKHPLRNFFNSFTTYRPKKNLIPATLLAFGSGAAWGTHEVLMHHNERFFKVFPDANRRFWGPESWKNKYWGFDPKNGRNRTPIYFTDAKHLLASTTQVFGFSAGALITIGEDRPVLHYVFDAGLSFLGYTAGNVITYNLLFR